MEIVNGSIEVKDTVLENARIWALLITFGLFLTNLFHSFKIALEMNLGFSVIINTIEFVHISVIEIALLAYFYSMFLKSSFELDLLDRDKFVDMSTLYHLD